MSSKQAEAPDPRVYGFNPISHHYVKKSGAVWLRLVKAGMAEDSELMQQIKDKALTRKKASSEEKKAPAVVLPDGGAAHGQFRSNQEVGSAPIGLAPRRGPGRQSKVPKPKVKSVEHAARKLVANNRSELDDLESDAVVEQIRKLKLKRETIAEAATSSASDSEEPEPVSRRPRRPSSIPITDRIRLKTQPIPIPDRRAALRQSLEQPIASDED